MPPFWCHMLSELNLCYLTNVIRSFCASANNDVFFQSNVPFSVHPLVSTLSRPVCLVQINLPLCYINVHLYINSTLISALNAMKYKLCWQEQATSGSLLLSFTDSEHWRYIPRL